MVKPRLFNIRFDNPFRTYICTQRVSGEVYIENDDNFDIDGVVIVLLGMGRIEWSVKTDTKGNDGSVESTTRMASKEEVYVKMENLLLSSNKLPRGQHTYLFNFLLPNNLPSSFQGKYGFVRYHVEAIIKRGSAQYNFSEIAEFSVNSLLDLNNENGMHLPIEKLDSKFLCCLCCKSGPISAKVKLPKRGFIPGENILISAEIDNQSSTSLNGSSAELVRTVIFKNGKEVKSENEILTKVDRKDIEPGGNDHWIDVPMRVPKVPPSRLDNCSIINISYHIEFSINTSGFSLDLDIIVPITIGNVALKLDSGEKPYFSGKQTLLQTFSALKLGSTNANIELLFQPCESSEDLKIKKDDNGHLKPIYLTWKPKAFRIPFLLKNPDPLQHAAIIFLTGDQIISQMLDSLIGFKFIIF